MKLVDLHPRRFFLDTWREIDAEALAERKDHPNQHDFRPMIVLILGVVLLTLMEYWGDIRAYRWTLDHIQQISPDTNEWVIHLRTSSWWELSQRAWWAIWRVLGYFIIPAIAIRFYGERLRDQGLSFKGVSQHAWLYFFLYIIVLLCVIIVSQFNEFSSYYPFYSLAKRSWCDLLAWEILYAAQFFALEFFFRGWWLTACKRTMGSYAIFVMVVPYVMIHYGKPMLETMGAIIAGVVLGTLAMRTRSIWSGFLIHVSVAVSMDIAALIQMDALPKNWMP